MHTEITTLMSEKPYVDAREQPVLSVGDYPAPPIRLVPRPANVSAAVESASVLRAQEAQQRERNAAVDANLPAASDDLHATQLLDSRYAALVADVLPHDLAEDERHQAGAVAVRLHDVFWQQISRYRAAEAALLILRKTLVAHGLNGLLTDSELRKLADDLAGATQIARLRTWDGSEPVTPRQWAKARLGVYFITEER